MNFLIIDVGTSSMRGILYDSELREQQKLQVKYSPNYISQTIVEQDPSDWSSALIQICRDIALGSSSSIDAISITSQRSSVIALSRQLEPIAPAIMWQDKRTLGLCDSLSEYNGLFVRKCGSRINPVYSASKMSWLRHARPEIYQKAFKLVVIPDYLISVMTGTLATDHTYAGRSLLMDLHTREWDEELLSIWGIGREKLCDLKEPGSIMGTVSNTFSKLTGIASGTPVISAGGDQQCSALGQGVIHQGDTQITAGTGAYVISGRDTLPETFQDKAILGISAIPGKYIVENSILACCSAFNWYHNCFYPPEDSGFLIINSEIEKADPACRGVIALPYFQGRGTPDWNSGSTASFHNITLSTQRGDMARALLEGICYEIKYNMEGNPAGPGSVRQIVLSGGLTKCPSFPPMLSSILEKPVILYDNTESTAIGAWMGAVVGCGIYGSYGQAYEKARARDHYRIFHPEDTGEHSSRYQQFQELYSRLYPRCI